MKTKWLFSLVLTLIILLSAISFSNTVYAEQSIDYYKGLPITDPLHIPANVPVVSMSGNHPFNDTYWIDANYRVIVYGSPNEVYDNDGPTENTNLGTKEYRYLGFDEAGNPFSNTRYPDDADLKLNLSEKAWRTNPWYFGLCESTVYSQDEDCAEDINKMAAPKSEGGLGWSPKNGGIFFSYGNVQSYPTLLAPGSFRMWHLYNGSYWYQTFEIPKKTLKLDAPFKVTTEILSSDFTIDENETTVDVAVKVTAELEDDIIYADDIKRVLYYNRTDIKEWVVKVEYKGTETYLSLNPNGAGTATKTFNIKLSRSQIVDMEKVLFNGAGRVVFHNDKYYRDSDPKTAQFTVVPSVQELPPDLSITAPAKVNVKEAYTIKVNPVVPQGESIKSIKLEGSENGGAYQTISLSNNTASQQYNNQGIINYRATVTLNNNKTATATASTDVVDERSSDATAKIEQPGTAYEGCWLTVRNKNTFTFEGGTYNAQQASDSGIGSSDFEMQDNSQYPLSGSLYQTRNYNGNVGFDIRYMQPGLYKNTIFAFPKNGDAAADTRGIQILRCPAVIASVDGTKKSNRKITLNFSRTVVHPDYPLVGSKIRVAIEDTVTGEKVSVTGSTHPDSTSIKTNVLSGNKMDFLVKTSVDKTYNATIYVEDTRGNNDTQAITFTVVPDKAPIAKISTKAQELRKPSLSNKAEIFLQDDSYSEDGDYVARTWEIAVDTDKDGLFTDETYRAVNTLDGYQDLSGDGSRKKVRFLKTGVGKINARVKAKEVFGQPTIDAFVTLAERKEADGTKAVDVINVSPVVDFKLFGNVTTTINIVVGSLSDTLQTAVQDFIASLQSQLASNKITPTINFIERSLNKNKPVWNQPGGNSQKTGRSQFNGVLNSNIKWTYATDIPVENTICKNADLYVTPEGNLLMALSSGSTITTELRLISKNGTLIKSVQLPYMATVISILTDGRILTGKYASRPVSGTQSIVVYDKNFNLINTFTIPSSRMINSNIAVDANNRIYFVSKEGPGSNQLFYLYVLNPDLSIKTCKLIGAKTDNYGRQASEILVDNQGNTYLCIGSYLYRFDINGNRIWSSDVEMSPLAFDEDEQTIYGSESYSNARYIRKIDAITGRLLKQVNVWTTFENVSNISIYGDHIYVSDYYRIKAVKKSNLSVDTTISPSGYVAGPSAEKAVISADGQVFTHSVEEDSARLYQYGQPVKLLYNMFYNTTGSFVVLTAGVFGSDNTLYLAGAYVSSYNSRGRAICNGNMFLAAYGTGGTEQNTDNTLRKLNDYIPSNNTIDFTVSITDSPYQDNADADITNTASLLKNNNDRFLMIGNGSSKPDGQKILNKGVTGSLFDINADMSTPLNSVSSYIINTLAAPNQKVYEYYYSKGEIVNYDVFYTDYEFDPSKSSQWRYHHTPKTDGTIANNGVWLSSPITQFTKNGTYRVQHRQADSTGVAAYDKYSNVIELVIYVEDGTVIPQPLSYTPEANIELEGYNKQNRKLTLKLNYSSNNSFSLNAGTIGWTLTPISGMAAADIKKSTLTTQNIDTLYKKSGRVRAVCTFRDTQGNRGSTATEFDIAPDLAPTGSLQAVPITYRNNGGIATINVKADVASPDDYISSLKYYITYDADNNGSYANDAKTYMPQYDNLREFNIDVNTGVGNYLIQMDAKEGFQEPTIPVYITNADYLTLALQGTSNVDNIAPAYDVRPEKDVYLVGEEIRFKSYDGSGLNGDASKGFFDTENDIMTGFNAKYMQNKAIMPSQDSTSAYHNQLRTGFVNSLDRAGEYTININAFDDPKDGDVRFNSFKKPSNTCTNKIIVHRRPAAALSFVSSHGSAPVFDFGNNMYLDGTHLRIMDASRDPDGFNVMSSISYKADSGEYVRLDSGDTINLFYGSVFTVKVVTADNWGADDTAIYTIMVANGLDMVPEVFPSPVAASENVILRLTTNQYATSARAVIFGQTVTLPLKSRTAAQKIWEIGHTIPAARADAVYTAQFYAVSEGAVEIRKDKDFQVMTPVNLVPGMPSEVANNTDIIINAGTSIYANTTTVQLFRGTAYQTPVLSMTGMVNGSSKSWMVNYAVPAGIPVGNYTARFTSTTPNGNTQTRDAAFRVESLKITGVTVSGYWNHWRGQVDIFGKQMSIEPHRFLSLEKVKIDVHTNGYADKVDIGFSPALESMQFTDQDGNLYDYFQDYGLQYVYFPVSFALDSGLQVNHVHWEYTFPLASSTVGWDDLRKKPQYSMTVTAWRGEYSVTYTINDIDITGNIYDLTYIQPLN